jgi:alkyldihydroxyacetonephosphate synthase
MTTPTPPVDRHGSEEPMRPTPPIELLGHGDHFGPAPVTLDPAFLASLAEVAEVTTEAEATAEASRDWWPLALHWALAGEVPRRAGAVVCPTTTDEVAAVLRRCHDQRVPVTPAGGRSGVCGASVPVFGGVVLDLTGLTGVGPIDTVSGLVEVAAGTFGPDLEAAVRARGLTVGHFPQSLELATVGGWIASRGAGQFSTRYGKIEDMVVGLEAVLADGTVVRTGGAPAAAAGPDLTQLLLGSEGTLAVITRAWLRAHPLPAHEARSAWSFARWSDGVEACRRILRAGATPAVLRLYDAAESARGRGGEGEDCILLVLDEGDATIVEATMAVVERACHETGATARSVDLVEAWMQHRNDTSALQGLTRKGYVVDTMEIAAPWARLDEIVAATTSAMLAVEHARAATCHLSHSYLDGACLYFTFAATPPPEAIEATYLALWDAGQRAVLAAGGNLSHHHGIGLNRGRFAAEALGAAHAVLATVKQALDPHGILNPGKLGLPGPFGAAPWPVPS